MVEDKILYEQLSNVLSETDFPFLGEKYNGKVRDTYRQGAVRFLITTDRLSCFDRVVTTVPFKGQVLNELAGHWFGLTSGIVKNHLIDIPDPNVMVCHNAEVLPIEVVVRAYITGSAWRDYQAGKSISGITLPPGLRASEKLSGPMLTPSTKAEKGSHDMPISEAEIVKSGVVQKKIWEEVREKSLALFELGTREAEKAGLILVDTKYEFGLLNGKVTLVDEIHTLDSSRYWIRETYQKRFLSGEAPEMLDKEPTRQWLLGRGFMGDGPVPEFTPIHRMEIARHYIGAFERITRRPFAAVSGPALPRIERKMKEYKVKA